MTRFKFVAWVSAVFVDTSELRRTVSIDNTLRFDVGQYGSVFTHESWIAEWMAGWTPTACNVLVNVTFRVGSAVIGVSTRIDTFTVMTCFVGRTVRIFLASSHFAAYERIAYHTHWASAFGFVNFRIAFSADGTRIIDVTWVDTHGVVAHLVEWTFFISCAANCKSTNKNYKLNLYSKICVHANTIEFLQNSRSD